MTISEGVNFGPVLPNELAWLTLLIFTIKEDKANISPLAVSLEFKGKGIEHRHPQFDL